MGICYHLILENEWDFVDWEENKLKDFEDKYDGYIEKVAQWPRTIVYNVEKSVPYTDKRKKLISEFADRAYYQDDLGIGLTEIDLPRKPNVMEQMASRRTDEEKRASEARIAEKLKTDPRFSVE